MVPKFEYILIFIALAFLYAGCHPAKAFDDCNCKSKLDYDIEYCYGLMAYNKDSFEDSRIMLQDLIDTLPCDWHHDYPLAFFVLGKLYLKPGANHDAYKAKRLFEEALKYSDKDKRFIEAEKTMLKYCNKKLAEEQAENLKEDPHGTQE
jgi:hypothetical protein